MTYFFASLIVNVVLAILFIVFSRDVLGPVVLLRSLGSEHVHLVLQHIRGRVGPHVLAAHTAHRGTVSGGRNSAVLR